jgi:flagellar biogenesis protein FliO
VKPNNQKKRSIIIVSAILFLAILGLTFIRTDNVAADRSFEPSAQTSVLGNENAAPEFGNSASVMPSVLRILSALAIVIGSIYGGLYLLKKMMGRKYAGDKKYGNLEVLETIHIAPKKTVTLLRVGGKSVLVGSTEGSMSLLSELTNTETSKILQTVETAPAQESFSDFFKAAAEKVKEVTRKKSGTVIGQHQ